MRFCLSIQTRFIYVTNLAATAKNYLPGGKNLLDVNIAKVDQKYKINPEKMRIRKMELKNSAGVFNPTKKSY